MKKIGFILWAVTLILPVETVGAGRDVEVPADSDFAIMWEKKDFRHELFTAALSRHVDDSGMIDYDALRSDRNYLEYLFRLANTKSESLRDNNARLVYWINAYNAFAIQGVLKTLPRSQNKWSTFRVIDVKVTGVRESGKGFFSGLRFVAGDQRYSLDEIEKAILLHRGDLFETHENQYRSIGVKSPDPRIHFALVCAAKGCVKLRRDAFEAERVDAQLNDAVQDFVEDQTRITFNIENRQIETNELLKWYERDFVNPHYTPRAESLTKFLAKYVTDSSLARSLDRDPWKITYFDYDWTLNVQR